MVSVQNLLVYTHSVHAWAFAACLFFSASKKGEEQLDQSKAVVNIGMTIAQGSHPQSLERNVNYDWKGYAAKHIIYPRDQGRGAQGQRLLSSHSASQELSNNGSQAMKRATLLPEAEKCGPSISNDQMDNKVLPGRLQYSLKISGFVRVKTYVISHHSNKNCKCSPEWTCFFQNFGTCVPVGQDRLGFIATAMSLKSSVKLGK
uniref:Uncharacterized protein n=1 Tax=Physcomitrium patens TaxID=3218 RepID=A0A2K1JQL7_PHYPA|nr:hypothetical protein PHYPA_016211 [Physcomitrium patens]